MTSVWGIHAGGPGSPFLQSGVVVLERAGIRDLRLVGGDREAIERELTASYPDANPGTVAAWAGVLLRFPFEPEVGDLLAHPERVTQTVSIGRIESGYYWEAPDRHCRRVCWVASRIPRRELSDGARQELSARVASSRSAITLTSSPSAPVAAAQTGALVRDRPGRSCRGCCERPRAAAGRWRRRRPPRLARGCVLGHGAECGRGRLEHGASLLRDIRALAQWRAGQPGGETAPVAVDMPIGLPEVVGYRECDNEARARLPWQQLPSVFQAPSRQLLVCATEPDNGKPPKAKVIFKRAQGAHHRRAEPPRL